MSRPALGRTALASILTFLIALLAPLAVTGPANAAHRAHPAVLHGATWNARHRRNPATVLRQTKQLLHQQHLDFLLVQEAQGYWRAYRHIPGYDVIYRRGAGKSDNVILVRHRIAHTRGGVYETTFHGWPRRGHPGFTHHKYVTTTVVAGWARLVSLHKPVGAHWRHRRIHGGPWRVRAYKQSDYRLHRFNRAHGSARVVYGGDWNAQPTDRGRWTPHWQARNAHARLRAPRGATHGTHRKIDFVMIRHVRITGIRVIGRYGSDHHAVVFTVHRR